MIFFIKIRGNLRKIKLHDSEVVQKLLRKAKNRTFELEKGIESEF